MIMIRYLLSMDKNNIFNTLIPGDILTTNRLPTAEERETMQQYLDPLDRKLQFLGTQISSLRLQIEEAKAQVAQVVQMEAKLDRLCSEETSVRTACAPYRLALSPFRSLPEDVLREICVACMDDREYPIATKASATPIKLTRISSVMRNVALTTPILWTTVQFDYYCNVNDARESLAMFKWCARAANEWFSRAGVLPLNITVNERSIIAGGAIDSSNNRRVFFDPLFSYSSRWREIRFKFISTPRDPLARIVALKATDVPILRALSLEHRADAATIRRGTVLFIPTLENLHLKIWNKDISKYSAFWENFTTLHIHGQPVDPQTAVSSIATILRQTLRLVDCSIEMGSVTEVGDISEILLPSLKTFSIVEVTSFNTPDVSGLLEFMNTPVLQDLTLTGSFLESSLSHFFQRSPVLQYLEVKLHQDGFKNLKDALYYCPSLLSLIIQAPNGYRILFTDVPVVEVLLKAFVNGGDKGYLCPRLHTFQLNWETPVPADCIREFLMGKREGHGIERLSCWAKVVLTSYKGQSPSINWQQTLAVVKEQREAGLNVSLVEPADYYGAISYTGYQWSSVSPSLP